MAGGGSAYVKRMSQVNHYEAHTPLLRQASRKRIEATYERRRKSFQEQTKLAEVFQQYDVNGSGQLEREQVIQLLTDTDSSTPPGTEPSDKQVDFMMSGGGHHHHHHHHHHDHHQGKMGTEALNMKELGDMLALWQTYLAKQAELEEKMEKYDISHTGRLSQTELKSYLVDLNDGLDVADEEVEMIMKHADKKGTGEINKVGLEKATTAWYSYAEHEKQKSACCTLS